MPSYMASSLRLSSWISPKVLLTPLFLIMFVNWTSLSMALNRPLELGSNASRRLSLNVVLSAPRLILPCFNYILPLCTFFF
jgi:hypothetical protein